MSKYYVCSGELSAIVNSETAKSAALMCCDKILQEFIIESKNDSDNPFTLVSGLSMAEHALGDIIQVNETGFGTTFQSVVFSTDRILTELGEEREGPIK